MTQQRAWIRNSMEHGAWSKKQKKETISDKEDCAGKIINEWRRQIIQAVTVGPLVLLLLRITHTQRHTQLNKGEEKLRRGSKRNLIVIYHQTFP